MKTGKIIALLLLILLPVIGITRFTIKVMEVKSDIKSYIKQQPAGQDILYSIYDYSDAQADASKFDFLNEMIVFNYDHAVWQAFSQKAYDLRDNLGDIDRVVNYGLSRIAQAKESGDTIIVTSLLVSLEKDRAKQASKNEEASQFIKEQTFSIFDLSHGAVIGLTLYVLTYFIILVTYCTYK